MMIVIVLADTVGQQLVAGIFSLQTLQFLVVTIFAILFPITSAAILNYADRKVMAWMQDLIN